MSSLMAVASASLIIPATLYAAMSSSSKDTDTTKNILFLSHGTSIILLMIYVMYLYFQLRSHADLFEETPTNGSEEAGAAEEEEEEERLLSPWAATVALIAVIWMIFVGVVFLFPSVPQPGTPDMNYSVVVLFGTLFLSLVWYYFPKYGGVPWFRGPVPTIVEEEGSDASSADMAKKGSVNVSTVEVEEV